MMHRVPRILLVLVVASVLAMHGVDATTTAQHLAPAPDAAHAAAGGGEVHAADPIPAGAAEPGTAHRGQTTGHHVVVLCVVALVGVLGCAGRRLLLRLTTTLVTRTKLALVTIGEHLDEILRPPPPAWVRLCVLRR